jgi:hypothetical protein
MELCETRWTQSTQNTQNTQNTQKKHEKADFWDQKPAIYELVLFAVLLFCSFCVLCVLCVLCVFCVQRVSRRSQRRDIELRSHHRATVLVQLHRRWPPNVRREARRLFTAAAARDHDPHRLFLNFDLANLLHRPAPATRKPRVYLIEVI